MTKQAVPSVYFEDEVKLIPGLNDKIVSRYQAYPHKIEMGAFSFVGSGEADVSINLESYHIKRNDIITILPGSVIHLNNLSEDFNVQFIFFSIEFVKDIELMRSSLPYLDTIWEHPVLSLAEEDAVLAQEFYALFFKVYNKYITKDQPFIIKNVLTSLLYAISALYHNLESGKLPQKISRSEEIYRQFIKVLTKHYRSQRSVSFYAEQLHITPKHLSAVIKSVHGKSVSDMIAETVILDAKAQMRSSGTSIKQISDSLSFANPSFFGKYFKKHAGLSPKQYKELDAKDGYNETPVKVKSAG